MSFQITIKTPDGGTKIYSSIGDRNALMDAAYDAGALGVTVMVLQ